MRGMPDRCRRHLQMKRVKVQRILMQPQKKMQLKTLTSYLRNPMRRKKFLKVTTMNGRQI